MNAAQLRQFGLTKGIAYKVRIPNGPHLCFIKLESELRAFPVWKDVLNGIIYNEKGAINALVSHIEKGQLTCVMCCCIACATDVNKKVGREFMAKTGEAISHGLFPECQERESARILREMEQWKKNKSQQN